MRLIDADILEKEGWSLCRTYQKDKETMVHEVKAISEINTALSSAQSRNGEWMDFSMSIKGVPTEACGVCGEWSLGMGKNFCPNCGADMRQVTGKLKNSEDPTLSTR